MSRMRLFFDYAGLRHYGVGVLTGLYSCARAYTVSKKVDPVELKKLPKTEQAKQIFESLAHTNKYLLMVREPRNIRAKRSRYKQTLRKHGIRVPTFAVRARATRAPRAPRVIRFGVNNASTTAPVQNRRAR